MEFVILDGYIDEPTCLGVPPYISTYPRYIAGSINKYFDFNKIHYLTIDQLRKNTPETVALKQADMLIVIAGLAVPGRYLYGYPMSHNEIITQIAPLKHMKKILCGPAAKYGYGIHGGKKPKKIHQFHSIFDVIVKGDIEIFLDTYFSTQQAISEINDTIVRSQAAQIKEIAIYGAEIIKQHPCYPQRVIAEIETYRGCSRNIQGGCSFCSEPLKGEIDFRQESDIHAEIQALYTQGIKHIRLGNQPCIFSYKAINAKKEAFPRPNPAAIHRLFSKIPTIAPNLDTIHIDNANPGILARYPTESKKIAEIIIQYHTSGDVAAFGVESVDPIVIQKNNLKASADEVFSAIQLLNEVGRNPGTNGMPELLPGLNFLFGLPGETKKTFQQNYDFLKKILDANLLIRRINIRKVIPIPKTPMEQIGVSIIRKHAHLLYQFKKKVQTTIERPMLQKMIPTKTILTDVYPEKIKGHITFGRQIGSYPLLIGIIGLQRKETPLSVMITDHGYRSITGVAYPLLINTTSKASLEALPGIGSKRAIRILRNRPFHSEKEFLKAIDDEKIGKNILPFLSFTIS